ncbi:toprim domain-containing protein [Pontibacter sp. G13]|uniref:toprim domain-containing protein n=1 Tax=Pontibacter sp. G13 TaxID=3074898 RepID=UPI00288A4E61|nr:toprim domain-containing protein [Pontibacter sp. G13]WNJ21032.1 toprim domain-containing protein [Pontibacter sp. G13]
MEAFSMNRQTILQHVSSYEILNHFLRPYHRKGYLRQGQHISNPFLKRQQETPSFNIYLHKSSGEWRFKDFSTADEGSAFDLVMTLMGCSFPTALSIINREFQLNLGRRMEEGAPKYQLPINPEGPLPDSALTCIRDRTFELSIKSWELSEAAWWLGYGITPEILNTFGVHSAMSYTAFDKQGKAYTITGKKRDPIFAIEAGPFAYKLYRPNSKRFKYTWVGSKPDPYVFGWDQLPDDGQAVVLTGGEKDVMTLYALGIPAISLNSETAHIPTDTIRELKKRFEHIAVLYDQDEVGIRSGKQLAKLHDLRWVSLPPMDHLQGHTDISDYVRHRYDRQLLRTSWEHARIMA